MQIATAALAFYTEYTGIAQPLKKFDLVAIPGKSGAMENWGLLLFDETRFLVNNVSLNIHCKAYSTLHPGLFRDVD